MDTKVTFYFDMSNGSVVTPAGIRLPVRNHMYSTSNPDEIAYLKQEEEKQVMKVRTMTSEEIEAADPMSSLRKRMEADIRAKVLAEMEEKNKAVAVGDVSAVTSTAHDEPVKTPLTKEETKPGSGAAAMLKKRAAEVNKK